MELSVKTTVLFSERQYRHLKRVAQSRKKSVGELIRSACDREYGLVPRTEAMEAVAELAEYRLPVADTATMKREMTQMKPESR